MRFQERSDRPVAQLAERRSPKPQVGGSIPSWPASSTWLAHGRLEEDMETTVTRATSSTRRSSSLRSRAVVGGIVGYYCFDDAAPLLRALVRARRRSGSRPRGRCSLAVRPQRSGSSCRRARRDAQGGLADPQGDASDDAGRVRVRVSAACFSGCSISCLLVADAGSITGQGSLSDGAALVRGARLLELRAQASGVARRSASSAPASEPSSARSWCPPKKWWRCATARSARASASSSPATCWCRWRWTTRPGTW